MTKLYGSYTADSTKVCAKCHRELPITAYSKANGNYPRSECRECGKKQDQFRKLLKRQHAPPADDYQCPICQRDYSQIKTLGNRHGGWCLDHDHDTGLFRGWLCHDCNKALGFFKDRADLLRAAIEYIENSSKPKAD